MPWRLRDTRNWRWPEGSVENSRAARRLPWLPYAQHPSGGVAISGETSVTIIATKPTEVVVVEVAD
jgi:hypothetical protein